MQLQLNINDLKANIFLELLEVFKKDNMINDYKIISNDKNTYDDEVLNDLTMLSNSINNAKNGLGNKTSTIVTIKNV